MRLLYEAQNSIEAHLISNLLEQQGISSQIQGTHLQGGVGELQAFGLIKILVNARDFEQAREVITEWETEISVDYKKTKPLETAPENSHRKINSVFSGKSVLFWTLFATAIIIFLLRR